MRIYPHLMIILFHFHTVECRSKCYSCATSNMNPNFITKQRGPQKRISNPLVFDNNCVSDLWIIKERAVDECDGPCFKWQQSLNNSGSYSTMMFRGCYDKMFDMTDPNTFRPPNHSFCTVGEVPLTCLSDASVIEYSCWCDGDYCNSSFITGAIFSISAFVLYFILF